MSKALEFAEAYSQQHGVRITPSHLVAKAISHCLKVRPELNGLLRRGKVYLRRNVSIFFQVNVPGRAVNANRDERIAKAMLSGTTVHSPSLCGSRGEMTTTGRRFTISGGWNPVL